MKIKELEIPGCFLIEPREFTDNRGNFVKTFQASIYQELGIQSDFTEEYYSTSHKNVLRGLHFQTPPSDHNKLVYCIRGEVLDAFVDLRIGSPTYKQHLEVNLSENNKNVLFLCSGIAHGFLSMSDESIMVYKTSTEYNSECDTGISWDSTGINWPVSDPIVSERDQNFTTLENFNSPFRYIL